jgi:hypothetical protein
VLCKFFRGLPKTQLLFARLQPKKHSLDKVLVIRLEPAELQVSLTSLKRTISMHSAFKKCQWLHINKMERSPARCTSLCLSGTMKM